ncbi:MAG TPA: hypothetical protein VGQ75_10485 [Thermoanaerobaculia bacterium]|nr:hypothetical protein [Thermoanaerobaculia bacterium]HEV8608882.1 hypothetical protein [Thermoanaerobaculia bacterium]
MSTEVAAAIECTAEPPHRFSITGRVRVRNGILVTLRRLDEPYPPRDLFITTRELKMGYENVFKACFVCVDRGLKENAIALPKDQVELGLAP